VCTLVATIENAFEDVVFPGEHRLCALLVAGYGNQKLARFYGGGTLGAHARREFALFDAAQVSAIVAYPSWKLEQRGYDPTIEQALENDWLGRVASVYKSY